MPCTDGGDYQPQVNKSVYDEVVADNKAMKKRLDAATRAACETLAKLEIAAPALKLTPATKAWWRRHQKEDAARKKTQAAWKLERKKARAQVNELMRRGQYDKAAQLLAGIAATEDDES